MLDDKHIKSIAIFQDSRKIFPNTDIKGGVLYLTYDFNYDGKAKIKVIDLDEKTYDQIGYLNSTLSGYFIPYGELVSIHSKIAQNVNLSKENIQKITSSSKPYGLRTDFFKNPTKYGVDKIFDTRQNKSDIEVIGLEKSKRTIKYLPSSFKLSKGEDTIYKWKLFAGKAMGSGFFGEKLPQLPVGPPGQIATETFIRIGDFETEFEAKSLQKYFYTKFFRALLGILKNTQDAPSRVYQLVPLQDFTDDSDIDWTKSISEIDQQLYKKYELSDEEIAFIEEKVKSMD